jgi:hypothetical protein
VTFVWRTIVNPGDEERKDSEPIEHVKTLELPGQDD